MTLVTSTIGQGLLWGILALGLYLSFRILNFPDMTVEGTFPFGAAVCVTALIHGTSPLLATLFSFIAGMITGAVTGLLYTKGRIPILLAGILTMTGVYSVNLRILGKAKSLGKLVFSRLFVWSEWGDSNSRPHGPEPCALPTALHPEIRYQIMPAA